MNLLYIESLLSYLRRNKKRTFISIAGIALGVLSLVAMSGLSGAMTKDTLRQLGKFGTRMIIAAPGDLVVIGHKSAQIGAVHTLTLSDAEAVRQKIAGVEEVSALKSANAQVQTRKMGKPANIMGVDATFIGMMDMALACGRGLLREDVTFRRKVAVLGSRSTKDFFDGECPVGEMIDIAGVPVRIVGVLKPRGSVGMEDYDAMVLLPLPVVSRLIDRSDWLDGIFILSRDEALNGEVIAQTRGLLRMRHGKKDFTVMDYEAASGSGVQMEHLFSVLSIIVAAIAYSVGALGIVAIMALSMYERLIEIAVKRVVGATRRDIFIQFLFESTLLSLAGALLGAAVAVTVVLSVEVLAGWPLYLPWGMLLFSMALSALIGVAGSIYPARRAMKFEPVKILKIYEAV
ncbi:ABC transporter permease [Hydrogenimonas sp.]